MEVSERGLLEPRTLLTGVDKRTVRDTVRIRPASRHEARILARLANMAGEGLPAHLWAEMADDGEDPLAVGARRAARATGAFSWRKARVATLKDACVGLVMDYDIDDADPPGPDVPPLLRPLYSLELESLGTRYINILAVLPDARRRGVARSLVADIAGRTRRDLTLIVSSSNVAAQAFYATEGFDEVARLPMGPGGPRNLAGEWSLMRRVSSASRTPPPTAATRPIPCSNP